MEPTADTADPAAADRYDVGQVAPAEVLPLRAAVLRPGFEPEQCAFDHDDDPDAFHAGARPAGTDGVLVGIATVHRDVPPWTPQEEPHWSDEARCWRLRGMATDPALRRSGVGRRLLEACEVHVRAQGGELWWCNARTGAVPFYRATGWQVRGDEFDIPGIGPHFVMWRLV